MALVQWCNGSCFLFSDPTKSRISKQQDIHCRKHSFAYQVHLSKNATNASVRVSALASAPYYLPTLVDSRIQFQFTDASRRDTCTVPCGAFFHPALCIVTIVVPQLYWRDSTLHSRATGDHCLPSIQRRSPWSMSPPLYYINILLTHFGFLLDYAAHHCGATERQSPCPSLSTRSFRNAKDPNFLLSPRQNSTFNSFVYLATTSGKGTRMSSRSS